MYRKRGNGLAGVDFRSDTSRLKPAWATDIPRLRAGSVGAQFWSVYVPASLPGAESVQATVEKIDVVHQMCALYPDTFELALTAADIERIHRKGKIATLIGMEGGHSINNSLATLRMMYRLGARYLTLTHTKNTDWADAAGDEKKHQGLTPFGEQVVLEMNRLGILVDLSQCFDMNAQEMDVLYDVCQSEQKPMVMHVGREPKSVAYRCDPYEICSAEKLENVLRHFPRLKICVPHLGFDEIGIYRDLIEKYDNLWLDTTMMLADYFPIREAVELNAYRADRIMYGSDVPNIPYAWDRELKWLKNSGLPQEKLQWILGKSAPDFFGLGSADKGS